MIFGILFLFGHYGDVPLSNLDDPPADRLPRDRPHRAPGARGTPPGQDLVPAVDALLRRQLGDHPVAVPEGQRAEEKLDTMVKKPARIVTEQVGQIYDPETAAFLLNKGLSFRAMHSHGRCPERSASACGR